MGIDDFCLQSAVDGSDRSITPPHLQSHRIASRYMEKGSNFGPAFSVLPNQPSNNAAKSQEVQPFISSHLPDSERRVQR